MIQHANFAGLLAAAIGLGVRSPADFSRSPFRQGGIWYAEVRHD